ncbi:MAG: DNA-3-methyladenine glycosylase [Lautropia sp.]
MAESVSPAVIPAGIADAGGGTGGAARGTAGGAAGRAVGGPAGAAAGAVSDAVPAGPVWWAEATDALCRADPVLARVIEPWRRERLVSRGDPFLTLARSIVGQQISVRAAQTIWDRFVKAARTPTPARVAGMRIATLTGCGLSVRKAEYLKDLAVHFREGTITPAAWISLDDEAVIAQLVAVRGIGRWTAEMFLIFNLMRPDVFPLDDIGLLNAMAKHFNGGGRLDRRAAMERSEAWAPWRTAACWYLWRSLDPLPVEY